MNSRYPNEIHRRDPFRRALSLTISLFGLSLFGCQGAPDALMGSGRADAAPAASTEAALPLPGEPAPAITSRTYAKYPESELRSRLSPVAYAVTQRSATEPAFNNEFWNNHAAGLYVDAASGEPLFSSTDKFDSGTGWPSFTRPVESQRVVARMDLTHGMERIEVRSRGADSHLGHVFEDGPPPYGIRYCINSAALRFVPQGELVKEGYGDYLPLFSGAPAPTPSPEAATANSCVQPGAGDKPGCQASLEVAVLAGGCFWGMEEILRQIPGVLNVEAGYTGGSTLNPRYRDVKTGITGHAEAVRVTFEPSKISYADLLEKWFFRMHDPTTKNRQGNDIGTQYRSAIFATTPQQHEIAEEVKNRVAKSGLWNKPIVTEIVDAGPFTLAEEEHQDYLQKHPGGYTCHYMR